MLNAKSGPRIRQLSAEHESYRTIMVDTLTPVIGAEIHGVNLSGHCRRSKKLRFVAP